MNNPNQPSRAAVGDSIRCSRCREKAASDIAARLISSGATLGLDGTGLATGCGGVLRQRVVKDARCNQVRRRYRDR